MELPTSKDFSDNELGAERPIICVTMGDPAGIGPEVILKSLSKYNWSEICFPVVIGDLRHLENTARQLGMAVEFLPVDEDLSPRAPGAISVFDLANLDDPISPGVESAVTGKASAEYIEKAVAFCVKGNAKAIATAPISKKALELAGVPFPGHTEFLASLTGTKEFGMSFFAGNLRVVLLSIHTSLSNAIRLVEKDRIVELARFTDRQLAALLGKRPRIAMAGLNPHASEFGLFGHEEQDEISPALEVCREEHGIDIAGPYSPDTIFLRAWRGEFDVVMACYHDQATIAVKCLSFGESVNVTLGLPFIRTSVDHGTAFDIAGRNIADPSSMSAAIKLAAELG